ncbi:HAMP domain-containing sensor histidine kinase [Saccharibacillus sacchari]|uniref:HAMP domain-containing sensor histidine kinase n=1 Tax=Saccharibacillus sacchari TaxID=456493 RepID=A0ACC6PGY9_9BACL
MAGLNGDKRRSDEPQAGIKLKSRRFFPGAGPKERPLKVLIGRTFYRTLLLSVVATVLTWSLGVTGLVLWGQALRPANYYENLIPEIASRIQALKYPVTAASQAEVQRIVPGEGLGYAVFDTSGKQVYGSFSLGPAYAIDNAADLLDRLNRPIATEGYYVHYKPLIGPDGNFAGAVALRYKLTVASSNPSNSMPIVLGGLLLAAAPFIYLYGFAVWGGRKLSRRLEEPFGRLIEGTEKIREHDLDFSLMRGGTGVRELNQLLVAFEQMREALEEALRREWESERERRDMIAAVAHDLGTPLSVIRGHAELLAEDAGKRPERVARYAGTIVDAADRSIRLTEDLSAASRLEHPGFVLNPEPIDLEAVVRAKAQEYAFLCRKRQATFVLNVKDVRGNDKRRLLALDPHRINRVLDNLVNNALRYSPENGVIALDVNIGYGEAGFEVRDDGPGFEEAGGGRIFEKFYREESARPSDAEHRNGGAHSGLGLFIARTIVRKHGGEIAAYNRPEGGAVVRFSVAELTDLTLTSTEKADLTAIDRHDQYR